MKHLSQQLMKVIQEWAITFSYGEGWDHFEVTMARTASREKLCNSKLVHCS